MLWYYAIRSYTSILWLFTYMRSINISQIHCLHIVLHSPDGDKHIPDVKYITDDAQLLDLSLHMYRWSNVNRC